MTRKHFQRKITEYTTNEYHQITDKEDPMSIPCSEVLIKTRTFVFCNVGGIPIALTRDPNNWQVVEAQADSNNNKDLDNLYTNCLMKLGYREIREEEGSS